MPADLSAAPQLVVQWPMLAAAPAAQPTAVQPAAVQPADPPPGAAKMLPFLAQGLLHRIELPVRSHLSTAPCGAVHCVSMPVYRCSYVVGHVPVSEIGIRELRSGVTDSAFECHCPVSYA